VRFGFLVAVTDDSTLLGCDTVSLGKQFRYFSDHRAFIFSIKQPKNATQEKSKHYTGIVEVGSKWSVWQTCRAVVGRTSILCRP